MKYQRENIPYSNVLDEYVLMDARKGIYATLNGVASILWDICETPKSVDEICSEAQDRIEWSGVADNEIPAFLESMVAAGFMKTQP